MMIKRSFLLFLSFTLTGISFSQDSDFGVWAGVNAGHKLLKKLDAEISVGLRTSNSSSQVEQYYFEGGLQYKFSKNVSLSGAYKLLERRESDSKYYPRHKLYLDLKGTLPAGSFSFSGRARIQRTSKTYIEDDEDLNANYIGRLKIQASYNFKSLPIKPYVYGESFSPVFSDSGFNISKYRLSAGTQLKITRIISLNTEYIFQRDFKPDISSRHIISINFNIRF